MAALVVVLGWASPEIPAQTPPPNAATGPNGTRPNAANPSQLPGGRPPVPATPTASAQWSPQLTAHIQAWEAKSKTITSLYTEAEVVRTNTLKQKSVPYSAIIMCMKPNLARMGITNKQNKDDYNAVICDGAYVTEYLSLDKKVIQHPIPPGGKGGVGDNLLLEFMSGLMTAADVQQRFDVTLEKEEEFYVHLRILPRLEKDKQEFEKMMLVLYGPKVASRGWDYLPAVVVFSRNDGQEVEQWTFKDPKINPPGIKREQFVPNAPPKDWQVERRAPEAGPKVVRP